MNPQSLLMALPFFFILFAVPSAAANVTKKLDQTLEPLPQEPDTGIKCGSCPCVNPCALPPPPPPPPPPPKTTYCPPLPPPPPPPRFIYVTAVPGNLYVVDPYDNWDYYGGARKNVVTGLLLLAGCGALHLMII